MTEFSEWVPVLVLALGGGGIVSSIVMLRKLPSERALNSVTAADKSVAVMLKALDRLEEEVDHAWVLVGYWQARTASRELAMQQAGLELGHYPAPPPSSPPHPVATKPGV